MAETLDAIPTDELLAALVARLEEDSIFSDPVSGIAALAENRMDLLNEMDKALAQLGLAIVVSITRIAAAETGAYQGAVVLTVTAQAHEIPFINRAESGTKITAQQALMQVKGLWDRPWNPNPDAWSNLYFQRIELTDADPETARVIWTLDMTIMTFLETVPVEQRITEEGDVRGVEDNDDDERWTQ